MLELQPEYLAEIARQLTLVSAFLGGFAAAYLGILLSVASARRIATWAICSAAVAASAFVVAVIALMMLSIILHPGAPEGLVAEQSVLRARLTGPLAFFVGLYALLLSIGCSGWVRSRAAGLATGISAGLAALLGTWALAGF